MKKAVVVLCSVFLIVSLTLIGCAPKGAPVAPPAEKGPVKIGVIYYMSAELKTLAYCMIQASRLAVKQVNDGGGIWGGRMVQLLEYDEGFTGEAAVTSAKKAIADGCVAVVGFADATTATAGQGILVDAGIPYIGAGAGTAELYTNPVPGYANSCCPGRAAVRAMCKWIEENGFKRVVSIPNDSKYSLSADKWMREYWDRPDSKTEVLKTFVVPYTASQAKLEATEAAALKPDFVFCNHWGDSLLMSTIGTLRELGFNGPWTTTYGVVDERLIGVLGPKLCNGSWQQYFWLYDPSVPANKAFYDAFVEMYKNEPPGYQRPAQWGMVYYTAMMPMLLALDQAGTNDPVKWGQVLRSLKWTTPTGDRLEVLPSGLFYLPTWYVAEVQNEQWVNVTKMPLAKEDFY